MSAGGMPRSRSLMTAAVILLGVAMGLTSYLVDAEIPVAVLAWRASHISSSIPSARKYAAPAPIPERPMGANEDQL